VGRSNGGEEKGSPFVDSTVPIVAIGASAGGLDALQKFFSHAPVASGFAFVVIQHLSPRHQSILRNLIAQKTRMPVQQAGIGVAPEANQVYVATPGNQLKFELGVFVLSAEPSAYPIDAFFTSLAEDRGASAIGIVLSGAGDDGTKGLAAIKTHGGLTFAQRPETAEHESMPRSAIQADVVDEVLTVEEMPARLIPLTGRRLGKPAVSEDLEASLSSICEFLKRATGHDFSGYKKGTLSRRILNRIQTLRISVDGYVKLLAEDSREPATMVNDILIGVTQFFRDPDAFGYLQKNVIPQIIAGKKATEAIRVWVAGCASGEEAYSMAILLTEQLTAFRRMSSAQVFATDIDGVALAEARVGRYPIEISKHISPDRLKRFFTSEEETYQVVPSLREMCTFSTHNLIRDPPFSGIDLVSCRNVLIYFEGEAQKRALSIFHYALNSGGYLFLGPAENTTEYPDLFRQVDQHKIFQRVDQVTRPWVDFVMPPGAFARTTIPGVVKPPPNPHQAVCAAFAQLMLQEYTPPGALVSASGDVLCVAGPTGRYLQPSAGMFSTNIFDIADTSLRMHLRTAIRKAVTTGKKVVRDVAASLGDATQRLRLTVRPQPGITKEQMLYMIVLEERTGPLEEPSEKAPKGQPATLQQFKNELRRTRAELADATERFEFTNADLTAANEELQSSNEELRSANEALQTNQEELRSVNEELDTVNNELRHRVEELDLAKSDLQNFVSSTDTALVFVDTYLRVRRYTPAAARIFHFIDVDVGRPLSDFALRFVNVDLTAELNEVIRSLARVERQVRTEEGNVWFFLRILPYRSVENVIKGAVITLTDITELKNIESDRRLATVVKDSNDAILVLDLNGNIISWNRGAISMYGYPETEALRTNVYAIVPEEARAQTRDFIERIKRGEEIASVEVKRRTKDGRLLDVWLTITKLVDDQSRPIAVATTERDITERKRAEAQLRRLATVVKDSNDAITVQDLDGKIIAWNRGATKMYGYSEAEALQMTIEALVPEDERSLVGGFLEAIKRGEEIVSLEVKRRTKDGRLLDVWLTTTKLVDDQGRPVAVATTERDITEHKRGG
jgi:two-component system CheB/CheR fusion protein